MERTTVKNVPTAECHRRALEDRSQAQAADREWLATIADRHRLLPRAEVVRLIPIVRAQVNLLLRGRPKRSAQQQHHDDHEQDDQ